MSHDETLGKRVRELLKSARLPSLPPNHLWGGSGSGQRQCPICGERVLQEQVAMEAQFPDGTSHEFHAGCFWALEAEWLRMKE